MSEPTDLMEHARRRNAARVPPHNLEAEESLLGAMMLNRDAIDAAVTARVGSTDFYKPAHGHVFEAIIGLFVRGEPVDPVTVAEELRTRDLLDALGGKPALLRVQAATPASANAAHYATIVVELALLRRLIAVAGQVAELGYDGGADPAAALDAAEGLLLEVADHRLTDRTVNVATSTQRVLDRLERIYNHGDFTGAPTGFHDLDQMLLGLQPGALYVIAGRPSMGKTALALAVGEHVAEHTGPALVFSLEMEHEDLTARLLAKRAKVDARRMWDAKLTEADWNSMTDAVGELAVIPLWIDDDPNPTLLEIRAKARRLKARHGLAVIVVDYMQLMTTKAESRQLEVDAIARNLKILARELEVPVIALSQLNRDVEKRADKRPTLSDLRDSGAIEQHADVVAFIYRDEVYNPTSDQRGTAEIIVAKQRNGPIGTIRLAYIAHLVKFADIARNRLLG